MGRKIKSFKLGHVRFIVPRRSAMKNIKNVAIKAGPKEYELE